MTARVVVLLGPVRSGKTHNLIGQYRRELEEAGTAAIGRTLWLAPNGRTATTVRDRLVASGLTACLNPGVVTFDDLTNQLLDSSDKRWKRIDATQRRELVRRAIEVLHANRNLNFFAAAADRAGFVDLIVNHISELKRRQIDATSYARATDRDENDRKQLELAQLYTEYEALRSQHGLIDCDDAQSTARDLLAQNASPAFTDTQLVIADGFTDFTSAQHDIFQILAKRSKQLLLSLPTDPPSKSGAARPELFAKSNAALAELKQNFPNLEIQYITPRPLPNAAVDYLTQQVFTHPNQHSEIPPAAIASLDQVTIVEAASAHDEVIQIARRIKSLLTSKERSVSPQDILVVFRSLTSTAPRIREVFEQFGIPYYLDTRPLIAGAPVLATISTLLTLAIDDWPFRRVISVLTNNALTAFPADARRAAEWLVRDLQVASGQKTLLDRARTLASEALLADGRGNYLEKRFAAAVVALPALECLSNGIEALPEKTTLTGWCSALAALGTSLGIAFFQDSGREINPVDSAAWRALLLSCARLEQLDAWSGQSPRKLPLARFLTLLREITTTTTLPATYSESGRVRILSAPAARNISAAHLFLAGTSELAFPSTEVSGLVSDAEYRRLARSTHRPVSQGFPAPTHAQEEMLLFYEVISRAEESLTISYPALDDKAQSLPASPYVAELERIVAGSGIAGIFRTPPLLSPLPPGKTPYNFIDWRIQAVAAAVRKPHEPQLLACLLSAADIRPLAMSIEAGLRVVDARASGQSFGPAEGLLRSSAIAARLKQRFGKQHTWSASQWETYATCPFRFFMQHVLGLHPLGDLVLETDFARRGSRLHDVLAKFHRDWLTLRKESVRGSSEEEAAAFLAHLQLVAHERKLGSKREGIDAALHELDHRQILKWSNRHFEHQSKYDRACEKLGGQRMTPTHFEFRFGPDRRGDSLADPDSTDKTFTIAIDDEPVRITGQIDRIDVGTANGKTVFNVIDYKSGRSAKFQREQLATGQQLQLPIYVEAAQALVFNGDATPLQAGYWSMGSGYDARGALTDKMSDKQPTGGWQDMQTIVRNLIRAFIHDIRQGDFPVYSLDEKCTSTCEYRTTCRVAQARSLGKSQTPPENLK